MGLANDLVLATLLAENGGGSGGGGVLVVTTSMETMTASHSLSEIRGAVRNGQNVIAVMDMGDEMGMVLPFGAWTPEDSGNMSAVFNVCFGTTSGTSMTFTSLFIREDKSIHLTMSSVATTPQ